MFGGLVRWGVPSLVISTRGRDERASPQVAHAAAAVATLEQVVGWPALAASLRVLASVDPPAARRRRCPSGARSGARRPARLVLCRSRSGVSRELPAGIGRQRPRGLWRPAVLPHGHHRGEGWARRCFRKRRVPAPARSPFGSSSRAVRPPRSGGPVPSRAGTFTIDTGLAPIAVTLDPETRCALTRTCSISAGVPSEPIIRRRSSLSRRG